MAGKIQLISGLADQTARNITQNADSWKQYLTTASRLYKYRFDDQLLIYAQRPDATACASLELWNHTMHRWVRRGSRGIALLRQWKGGRPYLDHVFDLADTRPVRGARDPYLWEMKEECRPIVMDMLQKRYGGNSWDLGECLMEAAAYAVRDVVPEYFSDLSYDEGESFGAGKDGGNMETCFRETLCASVQYTVLIRCGLNPSEYLEEEKLNGIIVFSEPSALHHLGNAVSTVSMEILKEIGREIRNHDRERANKQRSFQEEKKQEKALEKSGAIGYTVVKEEFNTLKRESKEGRTEHGRADVQGERGISDSEPDGGRGGDGRGAVWKIRDAAANLSAGAPQRDIHLHAADGQALSASAGDRQAGPGTGGQDGIGDDGKKWSGRSSEGAGSDVLAASSEQLHGAGGGSGAAGDRVQVGQEGQIPNNKELEEEKETSGEGQEPEKEEKLHNEKRETAGQTPAVSASEHLSESERTEESSSPDIRLEQSGTKENFEPVVGNPTKKNTTDSIMTAGDVVEHGKMQLADRIYAFYFNDPKTTRKKQREWDPEAAARDYRPMLDDLKYREILYQDMMETLAAVAPEDGHSYQLMKETVEIMGAYLRGEYPVSVPMPDAALQVQHVEEKETKGEPAGDLETAAHTLAGKQKKNIWQESDGQLSFDFGYLDKEPVAEARPDVPDSADLEAGSPEILQKSTGVMGKDKSLLQVETEIIEQEGELTQAETEIPGQEGDLPQVETGIAGQERDLSQAKEEITGAGEESPSEMPGLPKTVLQQEEPETVAPEMVEIEGGQIVTEKPVRIYRTEQSHDSEIRKLHNNNPEKHNFRITDEAFGTGGQKTKFQNNLAAIHTLKQIEAENRMASPQEQEILSRYVGWGGLAQAFDSANEKWIKEYAQLKEALTPEEYESARGSVLNAHYTSPTVIGAIYEALGRMDFTPGNILEPSCGIGNFFGLLPEKYNSHGLNDSGEIQLYGVELDSLTGRIAGQLYQKAHITVDGFEHTDYPDDFFDLAVGNVPFGEYKVHDRHYDRQNLLIHDYFLTKALDKVRPGGIMAFITTKGTLDKANSSAREGLAQKADLLGAIRLPNNAFLGNAGTSVTADILFFQKRGSVPEKLPDWVYTGQTESGIPINNYFLQHSDMVLGKMEFVTNRYGGAETACLPFDGASLKELLAEAVGGIAPPDRELLQMEASGQKEQEEMGEIPADPDVRNFSFTEKDGKFYFRENSRMKPVELKGMPAARARGMIGIRDSARRLIDLQLNGAGDKEIEREQADLNTLYDAFQKKYGLLNSAGNRQVFRQDASYPLLSSLEVLDGEGNFKCKADMFSKRTIRHRSPVTSVDTAVEALGVSIGERASVDLGFMASLMGGSEKIPQIISDLKGIIFKDPATGPFDPKLQEGNWHKGWQTADEYLSGNVRRKLEQARAAAEQYPEFSVNAEALEKVQPKDLSAPEISVRIGAPWIDTKYYRQFLFELLQTPVKLRQGKVDVLYSEATGEWRVKVDSAAVRVTDTRVWNTYGTKRMDAYEIFEHTLNQRAVQIFDYTRSGDGREVRILNGKQTAIAQQKQETMKEAFQNWIFRDAERRTDLCGTYNRMFNSTRPREYDGQHILFSGMNPEIRLETHQKNAVARILYGGNTLLAHVVGAGKTYEMVAAAMESRRLGLCRKSMVVVPNHLTEQWGSAFLTLYPGAKVLVATKRDFEPKNRKRFCARIATGDFDAVIIGHSQFEKIPLSKERQEAIINTQIDEIMDTIEEAKAEKAERFTVKQMEQTKKSLEAKLQKLHDKKKDDTVTFEELGVDRLFVDEAHYYKNLYLHTKMRNVAGISQTDAQKSSDMFAKCRYLDEITGGRGIVFATGTPISNSVVELYTMMRYLQYDMLETGLKDSSGQTRSLLHFDNWAATFGEQVTAVELKPEGTGFRLKTRFSRFYNLPELMNCWKEAADIQTAEMLKLPVPEAEYITIQTESSEAQKEMVRGLAERAEKIRKEKLDPSVDNMLKVTSDGRKLALDQRLMNPLLPDDPGSKVNACVENVFRIWQETAETKGTQLIFSDLSTPKGKAAANREGPEQEKEAQGTDTGRVRPDDKTAILEKTAVRLKGAAVAEGTDYRKESAVTEEAAGFSAEETTMESSVYEDIRKKLIARGIPVEEIAFIHSANTETQKAELFAKVRDGQVRVLLGSTQKMGAGTNVQTKLVASHDLDCPWRPADLEQRAGRIVRRGNENSHVRIYRYVTKGTFDAYTWGLVESKQRFIGQVMTGKSPVRSMEDVDATALSYAEVKMLATGDVRIKEKMDLDIQVAKLKMLKSNHLSQQYELQDRVRGYFPNKIKETLLYIECLEADLPLLKVHPVKEDAFSMTVMGTVYTDRKEAGKAIVAACRLIDDPGREIELGEYRGFPMKVMFTASKFKVTMKQHLTYTAELSDDFLGNIARINNTLERIPQSLEAHRENLARLQGEMENAREEMEKPFPQEQELAEKSARLTELNTILDNEEKDSGKELEEETEEKKEAPAEPGTRPSILKALKEHEPPAPANPGMGRRMERGAVR